MNFNFLQQETTRLWPQCITVKYSELSLPPLIVESSITLIFSGLKIGKAFKSNALILDTWYGLVPRAVS